MRIAAPIELTNEQRQQLEKQARARSVSVRLAQRSKMILLAGAGLSDRKIGAELGVKRQTVARWRSRFIARDCRASRKMPRALVGSRRSQPNEYNRSCA